MSDSHTDTEGHRELSTQPPYPAPPESLASPPTTRVAVTDPIVVPQSTPDVLLRADEPVASDRVRWGPIWAGFVVAVAVFGLLQLALFAVDITDLDLNPQNDLTRSTTFWTIAAAGVGFFIGGLVAGATAKWRHLTDGLVQGVVLWALITVALGAASGFAVGNLATSVGGILGRLAVLRDSLTFRRIAGHRRGRRRPQGGRRRVPVPRHHSGNHGHRCAHRLEAVAAADATTLVTSSLGHDAVVQVAGGVLAGWLSCWCSDHPLGGIAPYVGLVDWWPRRIRRCEEAHRERRLGRRRPRPDGITLRDRLMTVETGDEVRSPQWIAGGAAHPCRHGSLTDRGDRGRSFEVRATVETNQPFARRCADQFRFSLAPLAS